jgi:hypothetical protein
MCSISLFTTHHYSQYTHQVPTVRIDFPHPGTGPCQPPFGTPDVLNADICGCWSGYAPEDNLLNQECNVRAVCPGKVSFPAVGANAPQRPFVDFKDDHLILKQVAPITAGRRDTHIQVGFYCSFVVL